MNYKGSYVVPAGQTQTQFALVAIAVLWGAAGHVYILTLVTMAAAGGLAGA